MPVLCMPVLCISSCRGYITETVMLHSSACGATAEFTVQLLCLPHNFSVYSTAAEITVQLLGVPYSC